MKKIIAVISLLILILSLSACGKFTCNICQEEKSGQKHTQKILGNDVNICKDCYEAMTSGF